MLQDILQKNAPIINDNNMQSGVKNLTKENDDEGTDNPTHQSTFIDEGQTNNND